MNQDTPTPDLHSRRASTNKNLTAERGKATRTLKLASDKTQKQTNRIVEDERIVADQKTNKARQENDSDSKYQQSSNKEKLQLAKERSENDQATENERKRADTAIEIERSLADRLVTTILDQERKMTDKSLLKERVVTDTQLQGAQQLLTSRDEFLSIVSHDLRNPIGVVSSYVELLLEKSEYDALGPNARLYVAAIKRNADAALRLISDLMDIEQIAQGKLRIKIESCNAIQIIQQSLENFAIEAADRGIKIMNAFQSPDLEFQCDAGRMTQVLSNLVGNALKFSPAGSTITIGGSTTDDEVQFFIRDAGPGIPDEKKKKIFQRFAQLKTQDRTGLGLGLYISKILIEAHGGKIWVDSTVGEGSTFYLRLPRRP